ncbi:hypothetical protein MRB53_025856 [Persea americana]|uniref:Uncharacterized protein n=1 Tax=Persea americana TaxID=3435 RepID=A0ACC2LGD3_PERAE|nr:hypothetical protein MRB53_025856 [Persea americana]
MDISSVQQEHMQMEENKEEGMKGKVTHRPISFFKLLSYADTVDWVLMGLGTLGATIHGMAQPVGYLLLGKALDAFGSNIHDTHAMVQALNKVVPFVWYMALATLPAGILEVGCWMYASERQLARLRLAFLKAVLNQEIGAFDTDFSSGKIIAGITNHMNLIQDAIGEKFGHFLSCFAAFFLGNIIAFACCWEVALLTLLVVPLISAIGASYSKKMNAISGMRMVYLSEAASMVEQTISQIRTVFAFVGESVALKSFSGCMEKQVNLTKKEALIKGVGLGLLQTVTFCLWALIIWIGAFVVTSKRSNGGDTIAAVMSILFGAISLTYAAPDLQIFSQAKAAGTEVFQVLERKPRISYDTEGTKLEMINGAIDIRDVYFSYPSRDDNMILQGFSLSIPAGKVVALVGSSGCGKSTVISLVERFYDPSKGDIFIDNYNIKDLDLKFLRRKIGAVSQEPSLFAGTIVDNLKIGNKDASDELVENAASTANAHSFILQLPNQYLTEVGERGVQLSGGQKQRIAIARAILKDPPVLLLDEATSALDSESEKLVQDALERAMQGRTVILIAHRLSTVVNADMIAVVENGKVTETGSHQELLETSQFYNNLFNMQNLKRDTEARDVDSIEEIANKSQEFSFQASEVSEDSISKNDSIELNDLSMEEKQIIKRKAVPFFRIWFGLNKQEIGKSAIGSFAAALSGISKPVFGFFIMTIGVAYYDPDAKRKVGLYSVIFCAIAVLHNEIAWFEKSENGVGFLTTRIISDTSLVKTIISDRMSVIVQCVSSIVIATAVSMVVNWRMGLVAWAVMPCHFIGGLIQAKSAKGFSGDSAIVYQELVALASESVTNIRTVASFTHEEHILDKAKLSLKRIEIKSRIQSLKYGIIQGISLCLWNSAHAVALWYTTVLVDKRQATFKDGIRSYQIFSLTVPSITELWTLIPTVISAINILTPTFQTLDRRTEIDPDTPQNQNPERIKGKIDFEKVSFSYPSRPEVITLNKFSLSIEAGLKVALVGPSGAGKSSILALLLRFYNPSQGRVFIDDKDIKDYNLRWLRTHIGLVQQEQLLFSSSIRENICYGSQSASETEIVEVAIKANIHEFISNLPDGYNTIVGERGCQLSGGQKQRIAIARTLLKRPTVLLLDEATSALDAESERVVMSALDSMRLEEFCGDLSRCTQITVAHRLSTVVNSDTIVVMDHGEVVEKGNHANLIAEPDGVYARLCNIQSLTES